MEQAVKKRRKRMKDSLATKRSKKSMQNIPTAEELNDLLDAKTTFHSNFFKMQVDELIENLKEKMSEKDDLTLWMEDLKDFITNIPPSDSFEIKDFTLEGVEIPIIQTPESVKGTFKFSPPIHISEVGSYVLDTMCSASPVIDVAVEIPKVCWQGMDFVNHRYHRKRAFYLAYIAKSLLESDLVEDMNFSYQNECYLKPILLIHPKGLKNIKVSLCAYPSSEAFKLSRFLPSKNNVRWSWFFANKKDSKKPIPCYKAPQPTTNCDASIPSDQPTPNYNASILSDYLMIKLNDFLKENITSESIKVGIILLKLWCLRRGLTTGQGRLNGFILTMFVAYLLKKKKVSPLMSAYQIFRCTLLGFLNEDLVAKGISLCDESNNNPTLEHLQSLYEVVFQDISGSLNLCYSVTTETFLRIQHEAKLGIHILDNESPDTFSCLFMNKITFNAKFEYILQLQGVKKFTKFAEKIASKEEMLDFGGNTTAPVIHKMCDILRKGLNKRVSMIDVIKEPFSPWSITETPPNPNVGRVTVGFLLNTDVPLTNIEKGPVADDPKALDFRKFWGEQSELRRFQDGSIREAVHWPAATSADRRKVFSKMIVDILTRHMNADPNHTAIHGTEIDCILEVPSDMLPDLPPYGTGEEAHATLMQSFDSLCKQLRNLNQLPLLIASIQGSSPSFRFSEVFPPLARLHKVEAKHSYVDGHVTKVKDLCDGVPPYTPALNVIINLEGSGKWPDDVEAIKRVKAAFYIKICNLVKSQLSLMAVAFPTYVDVLKDGYVFRFQLACHKEIFLMKQIKMPNGSVKIQENKDSRELEIRNDVVPKLNSVLHGLHQQHNSFGTACRLAKRWISAQLYHSYIHDLTIELLVASIYVHPEPFSVPSSPQIAFIRFLTLLCTHDWMMIPLVVNLNNELPKEEIEAICSSFTSQRSTLPPMVIVTPFDKRGCMWTKNMPVAQILKRITVLAKASLNSLDNVLNNPKIPDIKEIFRPVLNSYDILIYLKRQDVTRLFAAVDIHVTDKLPIYQPYKKEFNEVYPIVEYDPVQNYIEELKENFGEFAFFLYDIYGGHFIAVKWKKAAFTPRDFTVSHVNCRTLCDDGTRIIPDIGRILEDFKILGKGIVEKVVKKMENWQIP